MLGLNVGTTSRIDMSPSLTKRVRMSLVFEATTKSAIGAPIRRGDPAREDVAEVAGRDAERDGPGERPRRRHVVHDLRHHARPVDRVDRRQPHPLAERRVVEHRLDEVLAIVERAVDRDRVHVVVVDRRHLAALDVARAAGWVEDHDVDVLAAPHGVDGRRSGIATRRADDRHVLVALGEHVLEEPPDELQRDVLERQGRPVEQLQQPLRLVDLDERRDGGMAECRVRVVADPIEHARSISPSTNGHITAAATSA